MNWKIVLGLLALVGSAFALPLGPYEIDYDLDNATLIPIGEEEITTTDGVNATGYAGVVLAPDGWALVIVNDFEGEVGITMSDITSSVMGNLTNLDTMTIGGRDAYIVWNSTEDPTYRAAWTLDGSIDADGILHGSDTVAVTMGGWDLPQVEAFLESISISAAA